MQLASEFWAELASLATEANKEYPGPWVVRQDEQTGRWWVVDNNKTCVLRGDLSGEASRFAATADPVVVMAMIGRIRRLEAAQCWAIVHIKSGVIDGPYATFKAAENERLAELCDDPNEPLYRVEPWKGGAKPLEISGDCAWNQS